MQKKILLLATVLLVCYSAFSQIRFVNLGIKAGQPTIADTIHVHDTLFVMFSIKNNGPDTIWGSDSVALEVKIDGNILFFSPGMQPYKTMTNTQLLPGDSTLFGYMTVIDSNHKKGNTEVCGRVWHLNTVDTMIDTFSTNNKTCFNYIVADKTVNIATTAQGTDVVTVSPNPVQGRLRFDLQLQEPAAAHITITDLTGRVVINEIHKPGTKQSVTVDTRGLTPGIYIYTVSAGNTYKHGKVEVQ